MVDLGAIYSEEELRALKQRIGSGGLKVLKEQLTKAEARGLSEEQLAQQGAKFTEAVAFKQFKRARETDVGTAFEQQLAKQQALKEKGIFVPVEQIAPQPVDTSKTQQIRVVEELKQRGFTPTEIREAQKIEQQVQAERKAGQIAVTTYRDYTPSELEAQRQSVVWKKEPEPTQKPITAFEGMILEKPALRQKQIELAEYSLGVIEKGKAWLGDILTPVSRRTAEERERAAAEKVLKDIEVKYPKDEFKARAEEALKPFGEVEKAYGKKAKERTAPEKADIIISKAFQGLVTLPLDVAGGISKFVISPKQEVKDIGVGISEIPLNLARGLAFEPIETIGIIGTQIFLTEGLFRVGKGVGTISEEVKVRYGKPTLKFGVEDITVIRKGEGFPKGFGEGLSKFDRMGIPQAVSEIDIIPKTIKAKPSLKPKVDLIALPEIKAPVGLPKPKEIAQLPTKKELLALPEPKVKEIEPATEFIEIIQPKLKPKEPPREPFKLKDFEYKPEIIISKEGEISRPKPVIYMPPPPKDISAYKPTKIAEGWEKPLRKEQFKLKEFTPTKEIEISAEGLLSKPKAEPTIEQLFLLERKPYSPEVSYFSLEKTIGFKTPRYISKAKRVKPKRYVSEEIKFQGEVYSEIEKRTPLDFEKIYAPKPKELPKPKDFGYKSPEIFIRREEPSAPELYKAQPYWEMQRKEKKIGYSAKAIKKWLEEEAKIKPREIETKEGLVLIKKPEIEETRKSRLKPRLTIQEEIQQLAQPRRKEYPLIYPEEEYFNTLGGQTPRPSRILFDEGQRGTLTTAQTQRQLNRFYDIRKVIEMGKERQRFGIRRKQRLEEKARVLSMNKAIALSALRQLGRQRLISEQIPKQITEQIPKQKPEQVPKQIPRQIQEQIPKQITEQIPKMKIPTILRFKFPKPKTRERIEEIKEPTEEKRKKRFFIPPPPLPKFEFKSMKKKPIQPLRRYRYAPSIEARLFNIRGKQPKGLLTGFGLRPLPLRESKNKKIELPELF